MTREKERINFQDKLYLAKVHKVVDTSRRDLADQKSFVSTLLNGSGALTTFIDDLKMETMARSGWEELMSIKSKNGNIQLLEQFASITEIEMKAAKKSRTPDEYNSSKKLYIVTWCSIELNPKRKMNAHRESIGYDGPTFLWYLFRHYHTTVVQTVRKTFAKMKNLRTVIHERCRGNINRFATYVLTLLLRLAEHGGNNAQAFDKVYKVLISSPCTVFNSEMIVYKQVNSSILDVSKVLMLIYPPCSERCTDTYAV